MSKNDKKLISVMLIIMMILSCISPVISNATTSQVENDVIKDSKLEEALLQNNSYYDKDKNGKFSKEELQEIYSITIPEGVKDLTGLEYATNAHSITYTWDEDLIDFTPINKDNIETLMITIKSTANVTNWDFINDFKNIETLNIRQESYGNTQMQDLSIKISDFSNCKNIAHLFINYIEVNDLSGIENFVNLNNLSIYGRYDDKSNLDVTELSKTQNLEWLSIGNCNIKNIEKMSEISSLQSLNLSNVTGLKDMSFVTNNKNLRYLTLTSTDVEDISSIKELKNLKGLNIDNNSMISVKDIEPFIEFNDYIAYIGENLDISSKTTYQNVLPSYAIASNWNVVSSNENIAKIIKNTNNNNLLVSAVDNGEAIITLTSKEDSTVVKEFKITVAGISANQATDAESGTKQINYDTILRENGELVKFYIKESKAEIIDTNVNKYVYEFIYNDDYTQGFNYTFTEKKDGTIKYTFNGNEKILEDAKDFTTTGYLTSDGKYMEVTLSGKFKEITDNVEKIVGSYLVKNDGKTYTITNELVCNFKIKASSYSYVVDEENVVWYVGNYDSSAEPMKKGENFKEFNIADNFSYITNDGVIISVDGNEQDYLKRFKPFFDYNNELILNKDNTIIYNGKEILTDVISVTQYWDYDLETFETINRALIVRKDSSIWCLTLSGEGTLKKMEEYTNSIYVEDEKLETKQIFVGEEGTTKDVLTGFDTKNLTIEEAISSDKLQDGYSAKVFDKDEKEVDTNKNIFTGAKIILYNEKGDAVKEYTALVYGDVTGKGSPSSRDALAIIKNKLNKVKIEDSLLLEAGRMTEKTRNNAEVPSAADALAIIKMKLGK